MIRYVNASKGYFFYVIKQLLQYYFLTSFFDRENNVCFKGGKYDQNRFLGV